MLARSCGPYSVRHCCGVLELDHQLLVSAVIEELGQGRRELIRQMR